MSPKHHQSRRCLLSKFPVEMGARASRPLNTGSDAGETPTLQFVPALSARRRRVILNCAFGLGCCFLLAGCSTRAMFAQVEEERQLIAARTADASASSREVHTMRWDAARRRMLDHNTQLQRSRDRVAELERSAENQWREWLPRPTLFVSLQNSLRELGDFSSDTFSASLLAPLTIPNPVTQQARTYQNALQLVQARDSEELNRRRQVIALYRLFMEWHGMEELEQQPTGTAGIEQAVESALRRSESAAATEERRQMMFQQLSQLLNMPGVDVIPHTATLPVVNYENRLEQIRPGINHGILATRLASYEIQGALLRMRGMRLSRWPSFNLSASTPPLYDSRRPDPFLADNADQISLFGALSQSFDVTGRQAADIRSAEDNVRYVRDSISQRLDTDARQWQRLMARYRNLLARERLIQSRLDAARNRGSNRVRASDDLETTRNLIGELQNLKRAKRNLDMEVWLWDDQAWK